MFKIIFIFYGLSSMLQFSQVVWPLRYSVWDVFNNFLFIDATDRRKISSDQKRLFIAVSLYILSFSRTLPFRLIILIPLVYPGVIIPCIYSAHLRSNFAARIWHLIEIRIWHLAQFEYLHVYLDWCIKYGIHATIF